MTSTDGLERLLAEATPLPWEYASDKLAAGNIKAPDNAALIVAAVNALPELLAENAKLREVLFHIEVHLSRGLDMLALDRARAALKEPGQ